MRRTLDLFSLLPNKNMTPCQKCHKIVGWKRISSPVNEQFLEPTFLIPMIEYSITDKDWTCILTIDLYWSTLFKIWSHRRRSGTNGANGATLNRTWSHSISHNMHCKSRVIINLACPQTNHIWHFSDRYFKNVEITIFYEPVVFVFHFMFEG